MKASQELTFDQQAAASGRALWPGSIRMGGVTYAVSLVRGNVMVQFAEGDGAGLREVSGVSIELAKDLHPTEPGPDTIFADLEDGGRLYRIHRVGGRMETDSVWTIEGVIDERAGA